MTYRLTTDGAAAVAPGWHWLPIDKDTPRGAKVMLISRKYGVAHIGLHTAADDFYDFWAPLPTFKD